MTTGVFHPRRLGARLLVAPLGEDSLGTVYRALHGTDERRFVRLRVLQSPELSPAAVFSAIARNGDRVRHLSHKAIVQRAELSVEDGTPFVAWYESAGWTLDVVLAKLRSAATPLPIPFALLVAERVCAALEHAWFSPVDGEPIRHGLLWPGFVSISNDAEVRLGGFGLAEAVLPSITRGRLARDIAPYAAPEARETGRVASAADTYSAGVLLLELLTGRRPTANARVSSFRSEDSFPAGIQSLIERCLAAPPERYTILELHRALQEQLAAGPAPVSSADLAFFLYTLLNPEARGLPAKDEDSTNPVSVERIEPAPPVEPDPFPARRRTDLVVSSDAVVLFGSDDEAPFPGALSPHSAVRPTGTPRASRARLAPGSGTFSRSSFSIGRWVRGAASLAAAVAIIVGVEGLAARRDRAAGRAAARTNAAMTPHLSLSGEIPAAGVSRLADRTEPASASLEPAPSAIAARTGVGPSRPVHVAASHSAPHALAPSIENTVKGAPRVSGRPHPALLRAVDIATLRRAAEDARFQAAWARIEANRREASELAADAFGEGKIAEGEADNLLRSGDFAGARAGFVHAASLFHDAEGAARVARLARIQLSAPSF